MGSSQSRNVSETVVDIAARAVSNTRLNCSPSNFSSNVLSICGVRDSTIDIRNFSQRNENLITTDCAQKADVQQSVEQALRESLRQSAEAVRSAFNIGIQRSENITRAFSRLETAMTTSVNTNCNPASEQINTFTFCDASGVKLAIGSFDQENRTVNTVRCFQDSKNVQEAAQQVQRAIEQAARSEGTGLFGNILNWVFIILIVGAAIFLLILLLR